MYEQQFLINLIFKPNDSQSPLHPDELQLLLTFVEEILKEVEAEERQITEEQNIFPKEGDAPCK